MKERLGFARLGSALIVLVACLALAPAALAQQSSRRPVSSANRVDVQRLQDEVYNVSGDISRLRPVDAARADDFQARLDDLHDEVIYLKVKQRKEGASAAEYESLRTRLDALRGEVRNALPSADAGYGRDQRGGQGVYGAPAQENRDTGYPETGTTGSRSTVGDRGTGDRGAVDRGDTTMGAPPARQGTSGRPDEIPAGTEMDVRLERQLSSDTAQVEDRFTATTVADLYNGNRLLIPAASTVRGVVTSVTKAGRVERTGKLQLAFDQVTVNGRTYPIHGTVEQALESGGYRQDAGKIGAGAGVGAIIGGILGGLKGALAGILIGGGGVVAATEGQDVTLPAGTVLRIKLDSPVTVR
jgi:hypothetical protein